MLAPLIRTLPFLLLFLACGQNAEAAISTVHARTEMQWDRSDAFQKSTTSVRPFTKKEKKKWRFGQWLKKKFSKAENETRKSKNGKIAWLALIAGAALGFINPLFFVLGFLVSLVFAIAGISEDEKKDTAVTALIFLLIIGTLGVLFVIALSNIVD